MSKHTDMSMSHTRSLLGHDHLDIEDVLVDQKGAPILQLVEDTSLRIHDLMSPACDRWHYARKRSRFLIMSCFDNFWDVLTKMQSVRNGEASKEDTAQYQWVKDTRLAPLADELYSFTNRLPDPLHLFSQDSRTQGYVRLEALRDVVVVLSLCPRALLLQHDPSIILSTRVFYEVLLKENFDGDDDQDTVHGSEQGDGQDDEQGDG